VTLLDAIRLGRISNLPTVWTNVLAAIVLAGGGVGDPRFVLLLVALSLAYIAGMYLNDAFDAEFDRRERPERPIPSGRVSRGTVIAASLVMLGLSIALLGWAGFAIVDGTGPWPLLAGTALAAAIVFYDVHHKANRLSPVLMGFCRALVYVTAGAAFAADLPLSVIIAACLLWSYIIGLTYLAKQENLGGLTKLWPLIFLSAPLAYGIRLASLEPFAWLILLAMTGTVGLAIVLAKRRRPGDIGRAVMLLIAGISLFDALMIAGAGQASLAALAAAGFLLTLALQRVVPGT